VQSWVQFQCRPFRILPRRQVLLQVFFFCSRLELSSLSDEYRTEDLEDSYRNSFDSKEDGQKVATIQTHKAISRVESGLMF
jgi:hypothetical protein